MASNVYTKNEILEKLASKGYFIDAYTLDTFFQKWKIESIFEDEQGSEFYDKNVLDIVLNNLFNSKSTVDMPKQPETIRELRPKPQPQQQASQPQTQSQQPQIQPQVQQQIPVQPQMMYNFQPQIPPPVVYNYQLPPQMPFQMQQNFQQNSAPKRTKSGITDRQTLDVLNNISLSDGTPLIDKVKNTPGLDDIEEIQEKAKRDIDDDILSMEAQKPKEQKMGILEGAMELAGQEYNPNNQNQTDGDMAGNSDSDFDDMSLLSESLEAQEKFQEYVISELQRRNADFNPNNIAQGNEFKLDISERTISMIARTMAKKIAKNINQIFVNEAKNLPELENIKEENKKLEKKAKELEEQNKKLRLLLSENKKYLSSFKPSIFGLYKKVNPETNQK